MDDVGFSGVSGILTGGAQRTGRDLNIQCSSSSNLSGTQIGAYLSNYITRAA